MALRKIALEGEACLSKVCRPVTDFNSRLHTLLDDLADTLADSGGVGLAAPQVGVLRRVCVVLDEEDQLIELVNPEIIYTEGEQTGLEGCLSVPGKYGVVTRPEVVRVRAQDRDGQWFEVEPFRCFEHHVGGDRAVAVGSHRDRPGLGVDGLDQPAQLDPVGKLLVRLNLLREQWRPGR